METAVSEPSKKRFKWSVLILIISMIFALSMCGLIAGAIYLDISGEQTVGTLNNIADCDSSRNCFTGVVTFSTTSGEEVSFHPLLQTPFIYEIDAQAKRSSDPARASKSIDVRYLKAYPKIAKVALALHLDYANKINFLFWGCVVALFAGIASRDKPLLVLDLRKRKK